MPLGSYFGGHGRKVAASMKKTYGKDWERVFYATSNKEYGPAKKKRKLKRRG